MSESSIDNDEQLAESSTADDEGAKSMFDAVQSALEPPAKSPDAEQEEGELDSESEEEEKASVEAESESEQEEEENVPFHKHPRWQEMLNENRQLKDRMKPVDELNAYLTENGLEMSDVDQGVELMRLLKHDPEKALEALSPVIEQVQRFNGQGNLPQDLQDAVDSGKITKEYARKLATEETRREFYSTQAQTFRNQHQQNVRTQQTESARTQVKSVVDNWESEWKDSDPDFDKKYNRVMDRVTVLSMQKGVPQTPEEALELANQARDEVEQEMKSLIPKKSESRTVKGGSSVKTAPEPTSMKEAISLALSGSGR